MSLKIEYEEPTQLVVMGFDKLPTGSLFKLHGKIDDHLYKKINVTGSESYNAVALSGNNIFRFSRSCQVVPHTGTLSVHPQRVCYCDCGGCGCH